MSATTASTAVDRLSHGLALVSERLDDLGIVSGHPVTTLYLHDLSRADFDVLVGELGCPQASTSKSLSGQFWHTSAHTDGVDVALFTTERPAEVTQ